MPDIHLILYLVYVACGLGIALWMRSWNPWALVLGSTVYVSFFGAAGLYMVAASRDLSNPALELVGQILLVIHAMVGGCLFSNGWGELRRAARSEARRKKGG